VDLGPHRGELRGVLDMIVVLVGQQQGGGHDAPLPQPARHALRRVDRDP
jgi:hypothetical protein